LSDQDISPEKLEALDLQPILEHAKVIGVILSDQDIPSEKSEALNSHPMLEYAKVV
jgi:hypothetical protein